MDWDQSALWSEDEERHVLSRTAYRGRGCYALHVVVWDVGRREVQDRTSYEELSLEEALQVIDAVHCTAWDRR